MRALTEKSSRTKIGYVLFFLLVLSWLYWGSPWYPAAKAVISGVVEDESSQLNVRWATKYGFNSYEMFRYDLQPFPPESGPDGFQVSITRTGNKQPISSGSEVILSNVLIDGREFIPTTEQRAKVGIPNSGLMKFAPTLESLSFQVQPEHHLRLEFFKYYIAGEVEIDAGGLVSQHDLYSNWGLNEWTRDGVKLIDYWLVQPDGRFTVSLDMPRYPVRFFQIDSKPPITVSSFRIDLENGESIDVGKGIDTDNGLLFPMEDVQPSLQRYYHPHRIILQILYALLTTWIFAGIVSYSRRFEGLKDVFINENRWLFWILFVSGCGVFAFWHMAFWPGISSVDSLKIWRAAQIPGMYLGDHPTLNVLFYQYLSLFWNNVAVVPLVQNVCTSLLFSHIFFRLYRWGLPLAYLLPCFLFTILSVPAGLYTVILWKDIPFGLMIIFLAFRLTDLYIQKRGGTLNVSVEGWIVLITCAIALVGFRHNGIIALVLIPVFILGLRIISLRLWHTVALTGCLILFLVIYSVPHYFGNPNLSYLAMQTRTYVQLTSQKFSGAYLYNQARKYFDILDILNKDIPSDFVHYYLDDRFNYQFLQDVRWNDVHPYMPRYQFELQKILTEKALLIYKKSLQEPWIYFSWNPSYMLYPFVVAPFFIRFLPISAIFSCFILLQSLSLVFIDIFNWRYYFFVYLALLFFPPMIITDLVRIRHVRG